VIGALLLALVVQAAPSVDTPVELVSPDGHNSVVVAQDDQGRPTWSVRRNGEVVIAPSPVVLELTDDRIGFGLRRAGGERRDGEDRYPMIGNAATGGGRFREVTVHFREPTGAARRLDLVVRATDKGVAFRVVLPVQPATAATLVRGDDTEFRFPAAWRCWGFNVGRFGSSHEGEFDPIETARIREHNLFDLPVLCETGRAAFALAESDLRDFSALYLTGRGDGGLGLKAKLSPALDDPRVAVRTKLGSPIVTPWRVVMLGDRAGDLVGSTLVSDLATPSRIADTSWIKPGLSAWDWWNGFSVHGKTYQGTTTDTANTYVDFAAAQGYPYALIDDGWYEGSGRAPLVLPGTDATRPTAAFDLDAVLAHARAKGVRLWLWVHWRALDAQMEETLAFLERKGVAGIKVDFMDRDDQAMVGWYERLLEATARHRLMLDLHGAFVPRGLARTWPHFVTQEGVLGAEYNKWSRRITARHNVMLAYTRALLGPMDYTPGGFRNVEPAAFVPRDALPVVQTSRAHGLAMYVVYPSPLAMVSDSPDTYAASPAGLEFLREVPTAWDETRFLDGTVGEHIVVARRKGRRWFVGAMNGETARQVTLPLGFLGAGRFVARVWEDGDTAPALRTETRAVTATGSLALALAASGGAVAVIEPARR
jgi:alpha-glucosidase